MALASAADDELIVRRLTDGDSEPVIVADFEAFSDAPNLGRLLADRNGGRPVYQIDPVGVLSEDQRYVSVPDLAAACADAFLAAGPAQGRVFVVGYCSAAGLSLHIARRLASSRPITVLLVRPSWPDDEHVTVRFAQFQANIGTSSRPCPDLDGDPAEAVSAMEQVLKDQLVDLAESMGLGTSAEPFLDLLTRYRAWLAFLLACRNDSPADRRAHTAVVKVLTDTPAGTVIPGLSPDVYQVCPLPDLGAHDHGPDGAGQGNAASPELAEVVLAQIAASSAAR